MTPEDLYYQDTFSAITQDTIRFYEEKFQTDKEKTHPMLEAVAGDAKKHMAHRIQSAWRRVEAFMAWDKFVEVSTYFLEAELMGDMEPDCLTDNILAYIHFQLEDLGIEVAKIRNGMRVKSKEATQADRNKVMELVIQERILDYPSKEDIKLKIYSTLAC